MLYKRNYITSHCIFNKINNYKNENNNNKDNKHYSRNTNKLIFEM